MMYSDSNESLDVPSVVWSKGDVCLAKWSGDDEYYSAVILKFQTTGTGLKKALVSFEGFGKEDNELVDINSLKRNKCSKSSTARKNKDVVYLSSTDKHSDAPSMSFITDNEDEVRRLSAKYSLIDEEEKYDIGHKTGSEDILKENVTTTRKGPGKGKTLKGGKANTRKTVVASGGEVKQKKLKELEEITDVENSGKATVVKTKPPRIPTGLTSSESEGETDTNIHGSGFSDLDMEKPYFPSVTPPFKKEPWVLSAHGVKPVIQVPGTMNQYLREYQREGIVFLYKHFVKGQGAILADDMGLGKTVQVIGFISAIMGKTGTKIDVMKQKPRFIRQLSDCPDLYEDDREKKPFLIIGPATVLHNWVDELETWGHFTVGKYHKQFKAQTVADLQKNKLDVVVTTFETCRDHIETINDFTWEAVIADEAHKIKTLKAEVTQALKKLSCEKRFGLTGTPLQNKLEEFWCILDWANPRCLGDLKTFKTKVSKVIQQGQKQEATKRELALARCAQEQLAKVTDKWMLRRTKKVIADQLPKKDELVVYCKPTPLQNDIYKTIMSQPDMDLILTQREPCSCGRDAPKGLCCYKKTPDGKSVRALTFTYMNLLLKAANHVALLLPGNTESDVQKKYAKKICEQVFEKHPRFLEQNKEASFRTLSDPQYCSKMKLLTGLLSVFRKKKSKIILFSLSTRLLNILEQYIISKGYEFRRLDGQTPDHKRMVIIKEFNKDPDIFLFLVSTKAGGVGLNLTGANVVIIFDPNWNPTHDLQAQDRAYRLGQTRDVKVYRLVSSGTIEETIYLRQIYKQQQANIAVERQNAKRYFHGDELFGIVNLFLMRDSDRCLTEDILKRNRIVEEGLKTYKVENYLLNTPEGDNDDDIDKTNSQALEEDDEMFYSDSDSEESGHSDKNKSDHSPVKRSYTSRTGKAKVIKYSSDSSIDDNHDDGKRPNTRQKKSSVRKITKTQIKKTVCDEDSEFHDSQEPSTSSKCNVTAAKSSKTFITTTNKRLNDDLDDLWDSFDTFDTPLKSKYNPASKSKKEKGKVSSPSSKGTNMKRSNIKKGSIDFDRSTASLFKSPEITPIISSKTGKKAVVRGQIRHSSRLTSNDRKKTESQTTEFSNFSGSEDDSGYKSRHSSSRSEKVKKGLVEFEGGIRNDVFNTTLESISDVLENCGVIHTHQNHKIIGPSRAEDHMTKCAIKDVFINNMATQAPAMDCDPYSDSSAESDDLGAVHREKLKKSSQESTKSDINSDQNTDVVKREPDEVPPTPTKRGRKKSHPQKASWSQAIGNRTVLVGQTPKAIRKQQFSALAAFAGTDPLSLAKQLIYSHPMERLQLLTTFYEGQDTGLKKVMNVMEEQIIEEQETTRQKSRPKKTPSGKPKQLSQRKTANGSSQRRPTNKREKEVAPSKKRRKGFHYSDDGDSDTTEDQVNNNDLHDHQTNCVKSRKSVASNKDNNKRMVTSKLDSTAERINVSSRDNVNRKRKQTEKKKGSSIGEKALDSVSNSCIDNDNTDVESDVINSAYNGDRISVVNDNVKDLNTTIISGNESKYKLGRLLRQPTLEGEDYVLSDSEESKHSNDDNDDNYGENTQLTAVDSSDSLINRVAVTQYKHVTQSFIDGEVSQGRLNVKDKTRADGLSVAGNYKSSRCEKESRRSPTKVRNKTKIGDHDDFLDDFL